MVCFAVVVFVVGGWLFGYVALGLLSVINSVVLQWFFVCVVWFVDFATALLWFGLCGGFILDFAV